MLASFSPAPAPALHIWEKPASTHNAAGPGGAGARIRGRGSTPAGPRQFSRRAGAAGVCVLVCQLQLQLAATSPQLSLHLPPPPMAAMLPADCSRRLVAELLGALEACQKKEKDLQQSLARCRVLLQPWEVASPPSPEPAQRRDKEAAFTACEPTPKDLKELELLTQTLEKALRVRKGIVRVQSEESVSSGKAVQPLVAAQAGPGARPRTSNPKACVPARPPATSQRASSGVKRPIRAPSHRGRAPKDALTHAKQPDHLAPLEGPAQPCPLPSQGQVPGVPTSTPVSASREVGAVASKPGPEQGKTPPDLRSEPFTLKEKGTQLQLPLLYKKIASRNSSLWAQIQHSQFDADSDVAAAKAHFLERMKKTFDMPGPAISPAEVQEEVNRLDRACHLLTQHLEETLAMSGEAAADSLSLEQEYRCLVTLEGLQATVDQHLLRLQELREAEEHWSGLGPAESPPWGLGLRVGGRGSLWNSSRLSYSSARELQTVAALSLRVAMLKQQIHLQEVLMEELLPLLGAESPASPAQLALYRAIHSQLCEAGERFSVLVRDEPSV
ncbi:tubulin epsilon and delta complex protein 2 isoform X2 [Monodelphis domestica]|uniref:tubulin epsilon and delta complex protein 2 isoform X2 n=1 Tax=Monodelphis domestica TaxID=13616 RepID=UPI00044328F4|nr:tubulin epsilon and delta complex protein 2 isoform X2 [Monodelphis domestica]